MFELIDPSEERYDAAFTAQLDALLSVQRKRDKLILKRLTSGPATKGRYLALGKRASVYYAVCQAHACDTTTLELLFDPVGKRMVGKLLDRCSAQWLGQPDQEEMAALEEQHRLGYPATLAACRRK